MMMMVNFLFIVFLFFSLKLLLVAYSYSISSSTPLFIIIFCWRENWDRCFGTSMSIVIQYCDKKNSFFKITDKLLLILRRTVIILILRIGGMTQKSEIIRAHFPKPPIFWSS